MAKIKAVQVEDALKEQLLQQPGEIKLLGSPTRPNSWTFKVKFGSQENVVKVIKPARRGEDSQAERETAALDRISRRGDLNVVQYIEKGKIEVGNRKFIYFVFPYIKGKDLGKLLSSKALSEKEAFRIFDSLVETILKLAEEGPTIHQDIKPGNIMIASDGKVLLLDFGIARLLDYGHELVKQQGPARYLSPEQVALGLERVPRNQRKLTFLSDIYSAGVVVLHMLLGDKFFSEWKPDMRGQIAERIAKGEVVAISDDKRRKMLSIVLQESLSSRAAFLDLFEKFGKTYPSKRKLRLAAFWNLHYWTTGTTILTQFAKENPKTKGGVIYNSEHIKSVENNLKLAKELRKMGWRIGIDPATYKLTFLKDHLAELKERDYYREDLDATHFYDPKFLSDFVSDVIDFQKPFSPDIYISPYLFVDEPDSHYLDITFSLFEETLRQIKGAGVPVLFGLAISQDLIANPNKLNALLDQLVLYPKANAFYIRAELIKTSNRPCSDRAYLKGLLELTTRMTRFKSILLSQVDQCALGLFANSKLSVAINPEASIRKQDIQDKYSNVPISGGPKKKDKRIWFYSPALLSDLDLQRDMRVDRVKRFSGFSKLDCHCKYCKQNGKDLRDNSYHRRAHFLLNFHDQLFSIIKSPNRKKRFEKMVRQARRLYADIDKENIKLEGENAGNFLRVWEEIFI